MNPAEVVKQFVSLLEGNLLEPYPGKSIKLSGGEFSMTAKAMDGDVHLSFNSDSKPAAKFKKIGMDVHGAVVCQKGIKLDIEMIPGRFDPFFSWEELGL